MKALHDLVQSGKVRYIGASSMWATQFARMQAVAERNGWAQFISMQNHYNLLYREEEREMFPTLKVSTTMETPAMQTFNTECFSRCLASGRSLGRLSDVAC